MTHASPTTGVSSLSSPRCRLSSDRHRHAATSCHTSFPLSQDELTASVSSFTNALSHYLPSRAKTEVLNSHHHAQATLLRSSNFHLYCYKKIISILITLPTTQLRLCFTSSITRSSRHRSSTCCCHFLLSSSHACHYSAQYLRLRTISTAMN
jgi:hypothetical protein